MRGRVSFDLDLRGLQLRLILVVGPAEGQYAGLGRHHRKGQLGVGRHGGEKLRAEDMLAVIGQAKLLRVSRGKNLPSGPGRNPLFMGWEISTLISPTSPRFTLAELLTSARAISVPPRRLAG